METQTKFRVYPKTTQFPIPLDIALHNLVHNYIRVVSAKTKLRRPIYPLSTLTNIKNTHAPFFPLLPSPPFLINISNVTTHIIFIRDGDFLTVASLHSGVKYQLFWDFSEFFEPGEEGNAPRNAIFHVGLSRREGAKGEVGKVGGRTSHLNADRSHVGIDIDISQWPIIGKERGGGYTFFCIDRRCSSNLSLSDDFIGYIVFLFFRGEEK